MNLLDLLRGELGGPRPRRVYRLGPLGTLLLGLLCVAVGYFVAFHLGRPILEEAQASADWPTTEGVILSSRVVRSYKGGEWAYAPEVRYAYEVEGHRYEGRAVRLGLEGMRFGTRGLAARVVNRYRPGERVTVYYDPQDPATAVLEPGASWESSLVYGIGLLFLGVGVLIVASPLRKGFGLLLTLGLGYALTRARQGRGEP